MKAMLFAAGLGSRLKPLTDTKPKALVEAYGKTLLQINIEQLIAFGVSEIVVNVHHFSQQVINYLQANKNFGANIIISDETELLLDTGGGLRKAAPWLKGTEPIMIQNVDIVTNIDYSKMLEQHKNTNALATLAIRNRKSSRYLMFNKNFELCGWTNTKTNEEIITRNHQLTENFAFSGVHIISPELLSHLPEKQVFGIVDIYLEASKTQKILGFEHNSDYWFDVGTPEKLNELTKFYTT